MLTLYEAREFFKAVSGKEIKFWNREEVLTPVDLVRETGFLAKSSIWPGIDIYPAVNGLARRHEQRIGTWVFVHKKDEDEWQAKKGE